MTIERAQDPRIYDIHVEIVRREYQEGHARRVEHVIVHIRYHAHETGHTKTNVEMKLEPKKKPGYVSIL